MEILIPLGYAGIAIAAFLAATILPFSSEVVFTALLCAGLDPLWLVVWASAGNTLGGMTCYWIGMLGKVEWVERWLRIPAGKVDRFMDRFRRYGDWLAFFSFLPGVGDVIAVAAGFMRCRWKVVLASMAAGKAARYAAWALLNGMLLPQ